MKRDRMMFDTPHYPLLIHFFGLIFNTSVMDIGGKSEWRVVKPLTSTMEKDGEVNQNTLKAFTI